MLIWIDCVASKVYIQENEQLNEEKVFRKWLHHKFITEFYLKSLGGFCK